MRFENRRKIFEIHGVSEDDHIFKIIRNSGNFYERALLNYMYSIKKHLPKSNGLSIAIDVGANIGNHSIFFCSFLVDHVLSFEPNSTIIPTLRRNLSENNCSYTLYECALGEKAGAGSLGVPGEIKNNIGAAKVDATATNGDIEISTMDEVMGSLCLKENPVRVALVKIDVEGMEIPVLKGAEKTIRKHKPHIFAEAASFKNLEEISDLLKQYGYVKLPGRWASTPVYHFVYWTSFSIIAKRNYFAWKRSANRFFKKKSGR